MSFDWNAFAAECPVAILAVQGDGTIVFANRAAATLVGYGLGELDGLGAGRVLASLTHPAAGRGWVEHLVARYAATAPLALVHRGGAELESHGLALAGHDVAGRQLCVLLLTMRTASLDNVRDDVAEVHRAIFDSAPIGIFYFDVRGVLTAINDRFVELIGSSKRSLIGLNTLTLKNQGVVEAVRVALSGQRARWEGDYTSVTGGRRASVRVVIEPIRDRAGAIVAGLGLVEDVTEQRRARELVERTERLASLGRSRRGSRSTSRRRWRSRSRTSSSPCGSSKITAAPYAPSSSSRSRPHVTARGASQRRCATSRPSPGKRSPAAPRWFSPTSSAGCSRRSAAPCSRAFEST